MFRFQIVEAVLCWLGSIFFVLGAGIAALLSPGVSSDLLLSLGATSTVPGRVVSERTDPYTRIAFVHPTVFTFRYEVAGVAYEGSSRTVDSGLITRLRATRQATVQVSSPRPAHARIAGTTVAAYGPWAVLFLLLPATGLSFLTTSLLRRRRRISAFTAGEATRATLIYHGVNDRIRVNGRHPEMLRWRFSVAGVAYEGSISSMDPKDLTSLVARGQVSVLYDPRNPTNNVPYVA